jgi:hypothetical protein
VKPRRTSVVTAVVAAGAAVTALALCAPGFAATARPHSAAIASTASTSSDPLAVYFRHDAVGRAQLSLALSQCGTERWSVKTATDDDRHRVDSKPRDVSIRYLRARHTPSYRPPTGRVGPVELTTYRVSARLVEYVREADGDDHLVLADSAGRTIIAEVPDPSCVAHISPVKAAIRTARAARRDHRLQDHQPARRRTRDRLLRLLPWADRHGSQRSGAASGHRPTLPLTRRRGIRSALPNS